MLANAAVERELARIRWENLRACLRSAVDVPNAFRDLLSARDPNACDLAYWRIENVVVVEGNLFEAAVPCVPVLLAALQTLDRSIAVQSCLLELLFQIVNGESHRDEVALGSTALGSQCRKAAAAGRALIEQYASNTSLPVDLRDCATQIIACIDREHQ